MPSLPKTLMPLFFNVLTAFGTCRSRIRFSTAVAAVSLSPVASIADSIATPTSLMPLTPVPPAAAYIESARTPFSAISFNSKAPSLPSLLRVSIASSVCFSDINWYLGNWAKSPPIDSPEPPDAAIDAARLFLFLKPKSISPVTVPIFSTAPITSLSSTLNLMAASCIPPNISAISARVFSAARPIRVIRRSVWANSRSMAPPANPAIIPV